MFGAMTISRIRVLKLALSGLVSIGLACDRTSEQASSDLPPFTRAPADTQWVTIQGIEFPEGMDEADPEILEAYVFAAKHPEVLRYMPCYCGCQRRREPHQSNYDCFVDIIDRSGTVPRVSPDVMGFS